MRGKKIAERQDFLVKSFPLWGEGQKCGLTFVTREGEPPFPHKVMVASIMLARDTMPHTKIACIDLRCTQKSSDPTTTPHSPLSKSAYAVLLSELMHQTLLDSGNGVSVEIIFYPINNIRTPIY
jgi:hypothetical protein